MGIYSGEKTKKDYGPDVWLPEETLKVLKDYVVSIKGPLTTPVGGGIRSLNVALRQELDLYVCLRPIQYFKGVPSPVKEPEKTNMVIFRENSEDIRQANLAAGGLLGLERGKLSRRNFEFFIESRDIPVYRALLSRVFAGGAKETCELALAHKGKSRRFLRLEASADDTGQSCR